MTHPEPEKLSVQKLLMLANQLSPEEQEELAEELELQWLQRELKRGMYELARGEGIPADEAIAELRARNKSFREQGST